MKIKKGDTVVVISGNSKNLGENKTHKVLQAFPKANRVIVEGVNMITRHTKPKKMGEPGGRIEREAAIDASNVMLYCSACKRGVRVESKTVDGKKVRVCKKCGKSID
ncbi:MAG: 50S ribosomal protein L24 [Clostridia bacterium]|nr:50S ribosomal protein L24 [Clostridia bacterium]